MEAGRQDAERQEGRQAGRQVCMHGDRQAGRQGNRQTCNQTGMQVGRQADRQACAEVEGGWWEGREGEGENGRTDIFEVPA